MSIDTNSCDGCKLNQYCFSAGFSEGEMQKFKPMVDKNFLYHKNEVLYEANAAFKHIMVIRTGCVKTIEKDKLGQEWITGFYFPGDVLGLSGIASEQYQETAVALDTSAVCRMSYPEFELVAEQIPRVHQQIVRLMSEQLAEREPALHNSAQARLAMLLMSISARMKRFGSSATEFKLPMTRQEMSNYLGLATETVSRLFRQLQDQAILSVKQKHLQILDLDQLEAMAMGKEA